MLNEIKTAVRNKIQDPVWARFLVSCATMREDFQPGEVYELPAGQFKDFERAGFCVRVTDEGEIAAAKIEAARAAVAGGRR